MHFLLAAGGTAGHINPALAAAQRLLHSHPDCKISYIGNRAGMEARLVPQAKASRRFNTGNLYFLAARASAIIPPITAPCMDSPPCLIFKI